MRREEESNAGPNVERDGGVIGFPVLGRALRARRVPPALRAWLDEHWRRPEHALPPHPFALSLDCVESGGAPAALEGQAVRATMPGFELAWRNEGSTWEWREGGAGVRLELESAGARIRVWGAAEPTPDGLVAIHLALCEAVRASGLLPVHGAAAVPPGARDGVTTFLGRSGIGKSTTLLRLMRAGWTPIAEDLCWVEPETLTLYGWDRGVHLWPGTLEAFLPELDGDRWRPGPDGKLFLAYDDLGAATSRRGTLARLALLARAPADAAGWEPLAAPEAVRALWEAVGVPLSPAARSAAAAWIGSALKRIPVHRLGLGTTALPAPPA